MTGLPCHIVANAFGDIALCGVADPRPSIWQLGAIRDRAPRARCFDCYQRAGLAVLFNLAP